MEERVHCGADRIGCQGRKDSSVVLSLLENVSLHVCLSIQCLSIYYMCVLLAKIKS